MQTKMRVLTAAVAAVRVRARRRTKRRRRRERAQRTRRRGLAGAHSRSSSSNNSLWQRQRMLPPCHRHRRGPLPALQELLPLRPLALL
jgi:hypothetical protein